MKIGIVGGGVSGCTVASALCDRYLKRVGLNLPFEVDIIHDPSIPVVSVGEGSTIPFVKRISEALGFNIAEHQKLLNVTPKFSIFYENFNPNGSSFHHPFDGGVHGIHFKTQAFSDWALEILSRQPNCNVVETNIEDLDSISNNYDYTFDCRGFPEDYSEYDRLKYIPVNAVVLYKSSKVEPIRHTKTVAHENGWYFMIPLLDETSYGYLYNDKITTKEEAVVDFHRILSEKRAISPTITPEFNSMRFSNYCHKFPLSGNVFKMGFRGSFVEPMEATANEVTTRFTTIAHGVMANEIDKEVYCDMYRTTLRKIEEFIMWHYLAGSVFKTPFWDFAVSRAKACVLEQEGSTINEAWEVSKDFPKGLSENINWGFWGMQNIYYTGKGLGFV